MTDTANLGLPCIEGSQAQKHVTHNEALRILDTLVQLAVLDRDLSTPPGSPSEGQRWIVKLGATGAWASHINEIAAWQDGAWQFSAPQTGWLAYVADEGALLAWNGSAWVDAIAAITSLNNMTLLGVGTAADATNPLSAKLTNTLFAAKTVAEGGDGNLRYKLSKEAAAKTLSFLLQDNYSGRAEIGLTGDDDFSFKVSSDGSTWNTALILDKDNGNVVVPLGAALFGNPTAVGTRLGTTALTPLLQILGTSMAGSAALQGRFSANASGPVQYFVKGRGAAIGDLDTVQSGDTIGTVSFGGLDGTQVTEAARIDAGVDGTPGVGDMPGRLRFLTTAAGSATPTERMRLDSAGNLQMGGANTVINANRHFLPRVYNMAGLPSASPAGQVVWCSNLGGAPGPLVSDGTAWRRLSETGAATVATNANFTLTPLVSAPDQLHTGTLTADRAVTLSTTNVYSGSCFRITRTGGGAFNLNVGTGPLKALATGTWGYFVYDGAAWQLSAYGAL